MVRWLRWHCPPDTGFEIRALAVWGRARYLSVTEAPHNTDFHTWMGKKQFCFFQTAESGNRTPNSGVKGSGANHYPRAPAQYSQQSIVEYSLSIDNTSKLDNLISLFAIIDLSSSKTHATSFFSSPLQNCGWALAHRCADACGVGTTINQRF